MNEGEGCVFFLFLFSARTEYELPPSRTVSMSGFQYPVISVVTSFMIVEREGKKKGKPLVLLFFSRSSSIDNTSTENESVSSSSGSEIFVKVKRVGGFFPVSSRWDSDKSGTRIYGVEYIGYIKEKPKAIAKGKKKGCETEVFQSERQMFMLVYRNQEKAGPLLSSKKGMLCRVVAISRMQKS